MGIAFVRFFQLATLVAGTLAAALPAPESIKTWSTIVAAAAYVAVLLTVEPGSSYPKTFILASLVLGLAFGFLYFWATPPRTITIADTVYIKGNVRPDVSSYLKQHPTVSEEEYFEWVGREPSNVWTSDSIAMNTLFLVLFYSGFIGFLAFGILGALEMRATPMTLIMKSATHICGTCLSCGSVLFCALPFFIHLLHA